MPAEALRFYDTLTRRKVEFVPRDPGRVSIYACGVTPYDDSHLGHARPAIFFDVVRRYLTARGWQVRYVQNFTDIDDKIIARAAKEGVPPLELSARYADRYLAAMDALGVKRADAYPKVSEHIPLILEMVQKLVEKGHAYVGGGDVYFSVESFPAYGRLSGQRLEEIVAGARVEIGEEKRHPADFALWKAAKPGEPAWESPWGPGRPGWHIECSAMSLHYLGNHFDIHGGGIDLIFPHHENEIAQSEAYTGDPPFVRHWLHNGLVTTKAEKMSKSLGNFTTVEAILKDFPPEFVRYFLLSVHYRSPVAFSPEALAASRRGWERLLLTWYELNRRLGTALPGRAQRTGETGETRDTRETRETREGDNLLVNPEPLELSVAQARETFDRAMADDWNTPVAISALFDLARAVNLALQAGLPTAAGAGATTGGRPGPEAGDNVAAGLLLAGELFRELAVDILGILPGDPEAAVKGIGPATVTTARPVSEPAPAGAAGEAPVSARATPAAVAAATAPAAAALAESGLMEQLVDLLLEVREEARRRRDFAQADRIRNRLGELGIVVEDTTAGPRWRRRRE